MHNNQVLENQIPLAPLKILPMDSIRDLGERINNYLVQFRKDIDQPHCSSPAFRGYRADNFIVDFTTKRSSTGESNIIINETVRGTDLFIMTDVLNRSITYSMHGYENVYSPDDHYQDLKRVIGSVTGKAHRITVIMPFLYEGRQHKRSARESLDCALMLKELAAMGVSCVITFDAHDPSVQNVDPLQSFDNFSPYYQFVQALLHNIPDLKIDKEHTLVISPDDGALERAVYFASVMGVDTGMFYKRRDLSHVENGQNKLIDHQFLGESLKGKDVIVVDDMISSGGSMIDTAEQLRKHEAGRVFICCTFGIFTNGFAKFDDAYEKGLFDYLVTTNLCYRDPELFKRKYYVEADVSEYLAQIIDYMNHCVSMEKVTTPTEMIQAILKEYNEKAGTL